MVVGMPGEVVFVKHETGHAVPPWCLYRRPGLCNSDYILNLLADFFLSLLDGSESLVDAASETLQLVMRRPLFWPPSYVARRPELHPRLQPFVTPVVAVALLDYR